MFTNNISSFLERGRRELEGRGKGGREELRIGEP